MTWRHLLLVVALCLSVSEIAGEPRQAPVPQAEHVVAVRLIKEPQPPVPSPPLMPSILQRLFSRSNAEEESRSDLGEAVHSIVLHRMRDFEGPMFVMPHPTRVTSVTITRGSPMSVDPERTPSPDLAAIDEDDNEGIDEQQQRDEAAFENEPTGALLNDQSDSVVSRLSRFATIVHKLRAMFGRLGHTNDVRFVDPDHQVTADEAEGELGERVTVVRAHACAEPARQFCPEAAERKDLVGVLKCLKDKRDSGDSLSEDCQTEIDNCPAFNCAQDAHKFCEGATDRHEIATCLKEHADELSKECVYAVNKHRQSDAVVQAKEDLAKAKPKPVEMLESTSTKPATSTSVVTPIRTESVKRGRDKLAPVSRKPDASLSSVSSAQPQAPPFPPVASTVPGKLSVASSSNSDKKSTTSTATTSASSANANAPANAKNLAGPHDLWDFNYQGVETVTPHKHKPGDEAKPAGFTLRRVSVAASLLILAAVGLLIGAICLACYWHRQEARAKRALSAPVKAIIESCPTVQLSLPTPLLPEKKD